MSIEVDLLRNQIIRPTLKYLHCWSHSLESLLLGTAAQETGLGQVYGRCNPRALGIYQIDPLTHRHIWDRFLAFNPALASDIRGLASQQEFLRHPHAELVTNLTYATAIAWCIYLKTGKPLPEGSDIPAQGKFWLDNFHYRPRGSVTEYCANYHALVENCDARGAVTGNASDQWLQNPSMLRG